MHRLPSAGSAAAAHPRPGRPGQRLWALALALGLPLGCAHSHQGPALTPLEQAREALTQGKVDQARRTLEQLHRQSPDDLAVARALAEAWVKAGETQGFIARLGEENTRRETATNHYMLGLARFALSANMGESAVREFERALELRPGEAELHYRLGLALLESEQFEASLGPLREAVKLAPGQAQYELPLAKALYRTGDAAGAVERLRTFVRARPSPSQVATARALMNQISDPFAGFPKAASARLERGIQWLDKADIPQEAILSFEDVLRDYPDLSVAHALLGLAYQRLDDAGRAVDELKRAIELSPAQGKNYAYLGDLYLGHQRSAPAREAYEKAVELNPMLDAVYLSLGDLDLERQDLKGAEEDFRIASALLPEAIPPRGKLALALQLQGDYPGADGELRGILQKQPGNVEFMLRLGVLHTERRNHAQAAAEREQARKEAAHWLQEVLKAQPENALASRALESLNH